MSTLEELNQYADNVIQFTDNRPSNVIFSYPDAADISDEITTTLFSLQRNIDIIEIVQPTLTNIIFTVDVSAVSGASVTFSTLPIGVTSTNPLPGIFKVQGIDSVSDWDAIKTPSISIPSGTQGSFEYTCTIEYTNDGVRKSKSWTVGKFKPIAALQATSSMSITPTVEFGLYQQELVSQFVLDAQGIFVILGRFSVDCTPEKLFGIYENLQMVATLDNDPEFTTTLAHGDDYSDHVSMGAYDNELYDEGNRANPTGYIDNNGTSRTAPSSTYSIYRYELDGTQSFQFPRKEWSALYSYANSSVSANSRFGKIKVTENYFAYMYFEQNLQGGPSFPIIVKRNNLQNRNMLYNNSTLTPSEDLRDYNTFPMPSTTDTDWTGGSISTNWGGHEYNATSGSSRSPIGLTENYVCFINKLQDTVFVQNINFSSVISGNNADTKYKKQISGVNTFHLVDCTDDYFVATEYDDTKIHIWNMSDGSLERTITTAYTPEDIVIVNNAVAYVSSSGSEIFNITTGSRIAVLQSGTAIDASTKFLAIGDSTAASGNGEAYIYKNTNYTSIFKTLSNPDVATGGDGYGKHLAVTDKFIAVAADDIVPASPSTQPYLWVTF